jgi:uncharacterized membrane protein required for colicin V production
MVDFVIAALFVIFFLNGWHKGLLRSILGPISLIVGSIAGYFYYQQQGDLLMALIISVLGPFLLNIILHLLLKIIHWQKEDTSPRLSVGRILGGVFCLIWSGTIVLLILALIMLLPFNVPKLDQVKDAIGASFTYKIISKFTESKVPSVQEIEKISDVLSDPIKLERIQSMKEFRNLAKNDKVQALLEDSHLIEQIQNKEFTKLVGNPKIQEIIKDEDLIKKFLALHQKLLRELAKNETDPKVLAPSPQ